MTQSLNLSISHAQAVELLRGLVSIQSLSTQEAAASAWLVEQMQALGYDRAFVDEAGNAVGEIGPLDATNTVVLLGHIDTVPGNIPVRIAETAEGLVLYGRGSVDAKGPLATFVNAVAQLGSTWAHEERVRLVVVGAVEEEYATSKGARFIAGRFNGVDEPIPAACIIGEPSSWQRVTLGYKGRLLVELAASQPMAHTAGPDASVAMTVVEVWNWINAYATRWNEGREKAFDQLSPSLRTINTSTDEQMHDHVAATVGIRLPLTFDAEQFAHELLAWSADYIGADPPSPQSPVSSLQSPITLTGPLTTLTVGFRGHEHPWRGDRNNALVRSFLAAIRSVDSTIRPGFVLKTGTSDMNVVGPAWGCPILAYGPGDSVLDHTPHEHVNLAEYERAIAVLAQALRTLPALLAYNPR